MDICDVGRDLVKTFESPIGLMITQRDCSNTGHTITAPNSSKVDIKNFNPSNVKQRSSHVKDFVELVDMEKLMMVAVDHINNNEINNFLSLEWSTLFHSLINKIVELDEFKKILEFLESKGFSLQFLGNNLNAFIDYSLKKQDDTYIQLQNNPEISHYCNKPDSATPVVRFGDQIVRGEEINDGNFINLKKFVVISEGVLMEFLGMVAFRLLGIPATPLCKACMEAEETVGQSSSRIPACARSAGRFSVHRDPSQMS
ncbi:unnamed protein product [Chilo suppressalis]|uniref:Uncharacterized protein n=1 Tax=Chilo suppressalis TaxID=168631 RepID=A0ABN8B8K2_CHISP|nr:unnamed protein product [Chilo suppressalis]